MHIEPLQIDDVSRETCKRLDAFLGLLLNWSSTTALVSHRDRSMLLERHVADSLALLPFLSGPGTMADLGSGAGFPGLVLAIATDRPMILIEANRRKAAFLREAVRLTKAPAEVHAGRIETMEATFDLILARAVAPLRTLLSLSAPRLSLAGRCLFPKGRGHEAEIADAAEQWNFNIIRHPSSTDPDSRILELSAIRSAR